MTKEILQLGPMTPKGISKSRVSAGSILARPRSLNGAAAETTRMRSTMPALIMAAAWPSRETALAPPFPPARETAGETPRIAAASSGQNGWEWLVV